MRDYARRAVIPAPRFNASRLRPYLERCGYRRSFIQRDVEFGADARVALAAFAHPPFDARSSCIVALDSPNHQDTVGACRSTGAPIVLTCHEQRFQWWRQGALDVRPIGRPVDAQEAPAFFESHSEDFSPQRVYRAKTWARLDKQLELSFVDVDLLPVVERDAGAALARLIEENYGDLQDHLEWQKPTPSQAKWMLQSVFWLVSAKMLRDKGVPNFSELGLHDAREVFPRIAHHHGTPVLRLDTRRESALSEIALDISRFSNLRFATTEALAFVYENAMITDAIRDELGTHRTPTYLVDYIVGRLAPWIEQIDVKKRNVFEPACGHAGFLGAATRLLTELLPGDRSTHANRRAYLRNRVHGCDIDPFALEIARLSLTLSDIPNPDDWDLNRADMFETEVLERQSKSATILLANPPFGNFSAEEREQYRSAGFACHYLNKTAEMLQRTLPHLPMGACFGVVVPQGLLHSSNAVELRRETLSAYEVDEIVLFPDKVFAFSDMESAVLIGKRRDVRNGHHIRYRRVREPDIDAFQDSYSVSTEQYTPQNRFQNEECDLRAAELEHLWKSLEALPRRLCDVADVGCGFSKSPAIPDERFFFSRRAKDRVLVFRKFQRGIGLHSLPLEKWANLSKENLDRARRGQPYSSSQVLFNYHPTSRGPWRLKALVDQAGHGVSSSFVVVRPKRVQRPIEFFWALLNSPIANAYAYSHLGKRDNLVGTMRKFKVPEVSSSELDNIASLVQQYFISVEAHELPLFKKEAVRSSQEILLRLDAAILDVYRLSRDAERELLDLFAGWPRGGVPFKFERYLPKHFKEDIHLREVIEITCDWPTTNRLRSRLIELEVKGELGAEESDELDRLQWLADLRTDLLDPINLEELEQVLAEMAAVAND